MLRKRAELIAGANPSGEVMDNEFRLIPDWNFTFDGSITTVLFSVDIQVGESESPQVQIWRRSSSVSNQFNKIDSREITLGAGNFTPSGVFQYRLTPPMQFQSGDVLGVYQPPEGSSLVRLYYNRNDSSAPVAYRVQETNPSTVNIGGVSPRLGEYILLSLATGKYVRINKVFLQGLLCSLSLLLYRKEAIIFSQIIVRSALSITSSLY